MEIPEVNPLAAELAIYVMREGLHLPSICGTVNRDRITDWVVADMYAGRIPPHTFRDADVTAAINMIEFVALESFKKEQEHNDDN